VTLRRVDARFALARRVERATVLGHLDAWRQGLELAEVQVTDGNVDLVVAPSALADQAVARRSDAILLEGRGGARALVRAGYHVRKLLPLPDLEAPDLLLPVERGAPSRYALVRWRPAESVPKRMRNLSLAALVERGVLPAVRPVQVVGVRTAAPPFPLAAAAPLGLDAGSGWFLTLGQGDALTRAVFHVFPEGSGEPAWVVKIARVPGYEEPFVRDERGLRIARQASDLVARHSPRFVGRFEVGGLHGSVETAAVGERLSTLLRRTTHAEGLALVEKIAAWTLGVERETAAPPDGLAGQRERLREDVLPAWTDRGAPADLVERVPAVPAVLQHDDLGTWNIVADDASFTVVDWESARERGFPLWDLLYFLVDALAQLDGARSDDDRVRHALALLRGELVSSPVLFGWTRRAVEASRIPAEAVGPLATLCWLHHGLSHVKRLASSGSLDAGRIPPVERIAPAWLQDPLLGAGWERWRN
jgi:hypothetical protein